MFEFQQLKPIYFNRKVNVCSVCNNCDNTLKEDNSVTGSQRIVSCEGKCGASLHAKCGYKVYSNSNKKNSGTKANESVSGDTVKCYDCSKNIFRCFVCKQVDQSVSLIRCSSAYCRRLFHEQCVKIKKWANLSRFQSNAFFCPAHTCQSCFLDNPGSVSPAPRYIRCIQCPSAYHTKEACLPAGTILLSNSYIICPNHGDNSIDPVNVSWCFLCSKGGHMICCESCPASFHLECLKLTEIPERFICECCEVGRQPLYGELLWCRISQLRWWPGESLLPRNVPQSVLNLPHETGQFVVHLFGLDEYHWVDRHRVFTFEEGDELDCCSSGRTSLHKSGLDLSDESDDEDIIENPQLKETFSSALELAGRGAKLRADVRSISSNVRPPHFKMIKSNHSVGSVKITKADLPKLSRCDCGAPDDDYPHDPCGLSSECLNREMQFECHPSLCRYGKACRNQNFTLRKYPKQIIFKTDTRGWGLKTGEKILRGQFVNEYVGDLIDEKEANRRLKWAHEHAVVNFYMMKLDNQRIIDAGPRGNISRFVNHSCRPNLYTQKWTVHGDLRVGLFALRDIEMNEELTFNYNFICLGQEKINCNCGAPNCSGYIGKPPKLLSVPIKNQETDKAMNFDSTSCSSLPKTKTYRHRLKRKSIPAKLSSNEMSSSNKSDKIISDEIVVKNVNKPLLKRIFPSKSSTEIKSITNVRNVKPKLSSIASFRVIVKETYSKVKFRGPPRLYSRRSAFEMRTVAGSLTMSHTPPALCDNLSLVSTSLPGGHVTCATTHSSNYLKSNAIISSLVNADIPLQTMPGLSRDWRIAQTSTSSHSQLITTTSHSSKPGCSTKWSGSPTSQPVNTCWSSYDAATSSHELNCFKCRLQVDRNQLFCHKAGCRKTYHLTCLGVNKRFECRWICPRHHCDLCARPSYQLCSNCTASFCSKHYEENEAVGTTNNKELCTSSTGHEFVLEYS